MERKTFLGAKIKALSNAMDQEMNRNTAALDLTCSQSFVLGYLVHHSDAPIYQKDIEREFEYSHPTVSGILQRLESKGFVTFRPGEPDRRCKEVLVTEKAMLCHKAVRERIVETEKGYVAGLSDAEIGELHRLLSAVMQNMGVTVRLPGRKQEGRK